MKNQADQIKALAVILHKNRGALDVASTVTAAMMHHDLVVVECHPGEECFVAAALRLAMGERLEIVESEVNVTISKSPILIMRGGHLDAESQERMLVAERQRSLRPTVLISERHEVGNGENWVDGFLSLTRQHIELPPVKARNADELGKLFGAFLGFHDEQGFSVGSDAIALAGISLRPGLSHGHDTLPRRVVDVRLLADRTAKTVLTAQQRDSSEGNHVDARHVIRALVGFDDACLEARGIAKTDRVTGHKTPGEMAAVI